MPSRECGVRTFLLSKHMAKGALRSTGFAEAWPKAGMLVMDFVPGAALRDVFPELSRQDRNRLIRQGGQWAAYYALKRTQTRRLVVAYWLKRIKAEGCN